MLYEIHELQRIAFGPWNYFAQASRELLTNPFSPFSHLPSSRRYAANAELVSRLTQDFPKPEFGLDHTLVDGEPSAVTEVVAVEKSFCNLLHFRRALPRGRKPDPKVLLVAPLSGHHATLLRDTVRSLLPDHEVYITDWLD